MPEWRKNGVEIRPVKQFQLNHFKNTMGFSCGVFLLAKKGKVLCRYFVLRKIKIIQ